jgi:uncharacterized protein YbjT (DUF2867 family)
MDRRVVTVFGGSGFIGRHLVRRLAKDGWLVRVAVRDIEAAMFLKPAGDVGQIVLVPASVTRAETVENAVAGANAVVNLVGILAESGKRTFESIHVDGAKTVATAAAKAGVERLVQVSAIGADEESDSVYAQSKAAGEAAVFKAFPGASVVRPSVVFGAEDKFFNMFAFMARLSPVLPVFGCPTVPSLSWDAETGKPVIDIYGDGGTRMQPVHVGDVADAIARILADSDTKGKTYELGGPQILSFKEIMEIMLRVIRRRRLLMPVPFAIVSLKAWFLEKLPNPLLTRDQVKLLKSDNVVSEGALGLSDLGIDPAPVETILPTYLARFRPQWAQRRRT